MRVLAVTPNYPPRSRVGAWLATHQFMRHLISSGHSVTAVALSSKGVGWTHEGVRVETARRGRSHIVNLAVDSDVVVSHFGDGGVGATIARKAGRPSVQMVHGHIRKGPASADLLVFNSYASMAECDVSGPAIVCHPPTPVDEFTTSPGHHVAIVNCSVPKGIKVAWRCAERLPHLPFLGVKGGYGEQVTPRARNFETIPTTQDMRLDVYARTRILLMPSEHETWGMAGVEAMCSGIPVIAHPTPGLRESLGAAGMFVDRDDTDGWVEQIERLHDPAEYAAASAAARQRADELAVVASDGLAQFASALADLGERSPDGAPSACFA